MHRTVSVHVPAHAHIDIHTLTLSVIRTLVRSTPYSRYLIKSIEFHDFQNTGGTPTCNQRTDDCSSDKSTME